MKTATIKSNSKLVLDTRTEPRISLPVLLFLRRQNNSTWYRYQVETENVSRQGARIICDVKLELSDQFEVYGFDDRFFALAIVRHIEKRRDGRWRVGLRFLLKRGPWIVY